MRAGYLGPPGTFGEEAARRFAPEAEHVPFPTHAAVAAAVDAGEVDLGILAIENSINGSVAETLDILVHDTNLNIQAELLLPIVLNLVAKPGTVLADIRVIYSHTNPLGQCRTFLAKELPSARLEAALSTADAVALAMERPGAGAIATGRAAELYGAQVLSAGIQDTGNNVTRFVVVGRGPRPPTGRDRTSIAFWFAQDRPGSLAGVLAEFAHRRINCTRIESRPTRAAMGEYLFLIDFEGHQDDALGREVLAAIRPLCSVIKVFGSYPRWS